MAGVEEQRSQACRRAGVVIRVVSRVVSRVGLNHAQGLYGSGCPPVLWGCASASLHSSLSPPSHLLQTNLLFLATLSTGEEGTTREPVPTHGPFLETLPCRMFLEWRHGTGSMETMRHTTPRAPGARPDALGLLQGHGLMLLAFSRGTA